MEQGEARARMDCHRPVRGRREDRAFTGSLNLIEPGHDKPKNHRDGREWVVARAEGPVPKEPVARQRKAARPVIASPMTRVCISTVPS